MPKKYRMINELTLLVIAVLWFPNNFTLNCEKISHSHEELLTIQYGLEPRLGKSNKAFRLLTFNLAHASLLQFIDFLF